MKKIVVALIFIGVFSLSYVFDFHNYIKLDFLKENLESIKNLSRENSLSFTVVFFILYILVTLFSIPGGAVLMTLTAGATFGFTKGIILVSFASTLGASLAFLVARYLFRDFIKNKFSNKIEAINIGLEKDGAFYLFTLRLIPIFPFFLINLVMGLSNIPLKTFYWISQVGMLAGTMAYVNAGLQLSQLKSLKGILSFDILLSFAILGVIPLLSKIILRKIKAKKIYKPYKK